MLRVKNTDNVQAVYRSRVRPRVSNMARARPASLIIIIIPSMVQSPITSIKNRTKLKNQILEETDLPDLAEDFGRDDGSVLEYYRSASINPRFIRRGCYWDMLASTLLRTISTNK